MIRSLLLFLTLTVSLPVQAETRIPQSRTEISLGFAPLVKQAAPAVVNIYARRVVEARQTPFMNDPFFEDFFRSFANPQPRVQNSLGSGVILSADGIVVSNYHVVGMATDIRVVLTDRREYSARVLLGDRESDLAILQLEQAEDLPYLTLRDSDQVEVGELAMAIGNPFGVGQTVTSGIVSGLARSGAATGQARGYFIQTDAAINPGNSGGALIDVNGDLIGINTSILSRSGGSNGIGFAIPARLVAEFVHQARAGNDRFERPWAGMSGQPVNSDLAESLGLAVPDGIVISDLHPSSPFAQAGMTVGDVITHVGGQPVNSPQEMLFRMTVAGIGETAQVRWMRDSEQRDSTVTMLAAPDEPPAQEITLGKGTVLPDLTVARANPAVIARFGLSLTTQGVLVTDPGPLGARVGLETGDVIRAINGDEMHTSGDVKAALTRPGRTVSLDLLRRGQRLGLRFRL
ncbi:trypsin-like peptidase domain-containing protein [Sedimentitalea nanhaiensis]|uniref:Do/DeqQ family serine protease n=1 Tax=Sedimentitalea nanhaiensis TaxID=999627 RepID=A0A1I7CN19_9RHOB|nr:trypsin-like peptidase domain-containing protein [Sedimentitalea nanhaiensis]SFU00856.1 Do/DeqQ family serine protease [Sedimentitalea nanhaiensis]